jgi:hypothetical protein
MFIKEEVDCPLEVNPWFNFRMVATVKDTWMMPEFPYMMKPLSIRFITLAEVADIHINLCMRSESRTIHLYEYNKNLDDPVLIRKNPYHAVAFKYVFDD